MRKIVAFIPNLFTLGNLFCGCLAIVFAFEWRLDLAAYMVFLAAFLDFFDGFLARILKVSGELGKQLDSLADMVSFGVVPGIIMFQWLKNNWQTQVLNSSSADDLNLEFYAFDVIIYTPWYCYLALIIPLFSCFRLAKFNLDERQTSGFIGLPTPANAIFFASIVISVQSAIIDNALDLLPKGNLNVITDYILANERNEPFMIYCFKSISLNIFLPILQNPLITIILIFIFSIMLVSEIPLFALKFKDFSWKNNKIRYLFLLISSIMLIFFLFASIPFIVILYILISIVNNIFKITV